MSDGRTRPEQLSNDELKRRWEPELRDIQLPDPFDLTLFCGTIAQRRGQPIHVVPFQREPDAPSGRWAQTDGADYIYVEQDTTHLHQQHIVLHEIGHMLAGHLADPNASASYRASLLPSLDPQMLKRILGRTNYSAEQEQEAEWFAREIGSRIVTQPLTTSADDTIGRARSALEARW